MDIEHPLTTRSERSARRGREEQERLLAAFEGSGLSWADFARKHGLKLGTFRGWGYRRALRELQPHTAKKAEKSNKHTTFRPQRHHVEIARLHFANFFQKILGGPPNGLIVSSPFDRGADHHKFAHVFAS